MNSFVYWSFVICNVPFTILVYYKGVKTNSNYVAMILYQTGLLKSRNNNARRIICSIFVIFVYPWIIQNHKYSILFHFQYNILWYYYAIQWIIQLIVPDLFHNSIKNLFIWQIESHIFRIIFSLIIIWRCSKWYRRFSKDCISKFQKLFLYLFNDNIWMMQNN